MAGLGIANVVVPEAKLRERVQHALTRGMVTEVTVFGVTALQAAYDEGKEWLQAVNRYIGDNYRFLCTFIEQNMPRLSVTELEGTYLAWVDCSVLNRPSDEITEYLNEHNQVRLNSGSSYGDDRFIRINLACPRQRLSEGLKRIAEGLKALL